MSDTQIVPVQPNNAVLAQGGLGLDGGSQKPEPLILVQPSTTDVPRGTPIGDFFDKASGLNWPKLKLVPLFFSYPRNKYPKPYRKGDKPTCKSYDGLVPVKDSKFLVPEAPECGHVDKETGRFVATCDFAKWDGNTPPQCRDGVRMTFLDMETQMPFYITMTGTSVKSGKELKSRIERLAPMLSRKEKRGLSMFDFTVEMSSAPANGSTAYMVVFDSPKLVTAAESAQFGEFYLEILRQRELDAQRRLAARNNDDVNQAAGAILDAEYDEDNPVEV